MRCCCCNKNLNDFESTRKNAETGEYLDMCNKCYGEISKDVPSVTRSDLEATEQIEMETFDHEIDWLGDDNES